MPGIFGCDPACGSHDRLGQEWRGRRGRAPLLAVRGGAGPEARMATIEELRRETTVPVVIADHNGSITYVNRPFQELIGWDPAEILGKPITTIIPRKLRDSH